MNPKKRKPAHKTSLVKKEFDIDLTLLGNRQLFLYDAVDEDSSLKIIKALYALDTLNTKPIMLYLNTPGGHCSDGLSIIDAIKTITSPVVTIITNEVCSMGGHISVAGNKRACYENSVWMAHDMASYVEDYSLKIKDRAEFLEKYYNILEENLRKHTKLSDKEIEKARVGELWLFADDMLEKGIVDEIIVTE
jgi:ATP-dependent Clp protease protease subunit